MKSLLLALACLTPAVSFAETRGDVELSYYSVSGSSSGESANALLALLEEFGVKPYPSFSGRLITEITDGKVTMTNGAACDDGRRTYSVEFDVLDRKGKVQNHVVLNDSDVCASGSRAERFNEMLERFGADKLEGDCGLGHCWMSVEHITCYHGAQGTPDAPHCTVSVRSGLKE